MTNTCSLQSELRAADRLCTVRWVERFARASLHARTRRSFTRTASIGHHPTRCILNPTSMCSSLILECTVQARWRTRPSSCSDSQRLRFKGLVAPVCIAVIYVPNPNPAISSCAADLWCCVRLQVQCEGSVLVALPLGLRQHVHTRVHARQMVTIVQMVQGGDDGR